MPGASSIRIVTDTTASLPPGYAAAHQVAVVPQVILFGEQSYFENVTLEIDEFVQRLKTAAQLPKTAAPEPAHFIEAYRRQLAQAHTILSIHPSSEVSGTIRSAQTARAGEFPNADIRILDTRTVAGNLGTLVQLAVGWAEAGLGADEIINRLHALIPRGHTYFLPATLEYLQRGGRIGGAAALLGSVLQIRPILEIREGRVEALERIRTHHRALERLKELVVERCPRSPDAHLCLMHAADPDEAARLAADLQAALGLEVPIYTVGAAIATHAGPGTLGVAFFEMRSDDRARTAGASHNPR
jgi:DegV family protein with EDD domain